MKYFYEVQIFSNKYHYFFRQGYFYVAKKLVETWFNYFQLS